MSENQEGVISLPTGKTPEYFIKWTKHLLNNWNDTLLEKLRKENGLSIYKKPDLYGLQFVQIDEFYPIDSSQHNSFYNYANILHITFIDKIKGFFIKISNKTKEIFKKKEN